MRHDTAPEPSLGEPRHADGEALSLSHVVSCIHGKSLQVLGMEGLVSIPTVLQRKREGWAHSGLGAEDGKALSQC